MATTDIFSTIDFPPLARKAQHVGLADLIREGLPPQSAISLQEKVGFSNRDLERITGMSYRTLRRHVKKDTHLSPVVSDRIVRFLSVLKQSSDTLGNVENSIQWMHRPCQPLGNKNPIEMLDTEAGTSEVLDILGRIRHGVFS